MPATPYIIWNDQASVGQAELDSQHKVIFGLVNELYDALQEGSSKTPVHDLIEQACLYAQQHFETEETMLERCGYPRLQEHKKLHQDYTRSVTQIRRNAQISQEEIALELFSFLKQWWLKHVTHSDREYAIFLNQ